MKSSNLFAALALVFVIFAAVVAGAFDYAKAQDDVDTTKCEIDTSFARFIMEQRQLGAPIEQSVDLAKGAEPMYQIVIRAYQRPMYSSWGFQSAEIDKFANAEYIRCANAIKP